MLSTKMELALQWMLAHCGIPGKGNNDYRAKGEVNLVWPHGCH